MKYRIIHRTEYNYSDTATICHNIAHLAPRNDGGQRCVSHYISVVPQPVIFEERTDYFGNRAVYFSIERPHKNMVVTATSDVEPARETGLPASAATWRNFAVDLEALPLSAQLESRAYMLESSMAPHLAEVREFARPCFEQNELIQDAARCLMQRIFAEFKYDPQFTTLATPLARVLQHKRGVCQDFAHLAIACLRSFGLAARYVSGYLETLPPPGQEKLVGADASHAWLSVYLPDYGWFDLDPTNNQHPDNRYVVISWGRDYSDVAPLKGVFYGGGAHELDVAVDVERID